MCSSDLHALGVGGLASRLQLVAIWRCCSGCEVKSRHALGMNLLAVKLQQVATWRCCSGCEVKSRLALGIYKIVCVLLGMGGM